MFVCPKSTIMITNERQSLLYELRVQTKHGQLHFVQTKGSCRCNNLQTCHGSCSIIKRPETWSFSTKWKSYYNILLQVISNCLEICVEPSFIKISMSQCTCKHQTTTTTKSKPQCCIYSSNYDFQFSAALSCLLSIDALLFLAKFLFLASRWLPGLLLTARLLVR